MIRGTIDGFFDAIADVAELTSKWLRGTKGEFGSKKADQNGAIGQWKAGTLSQQKTNGTSKSSAVRRKIR